LKTNTIKIPIGYLKREMKDLPLPTNIFFRTEKEFAKWFEKNLIAFGFKSIKKKNVKSFPDYILKDFKGKEVRVELEIKSSNFIHHKHNPKKVDVIISVYTLKEKILGVPVFSLFYTFPKEHTTVMIRESERNWLERLKRKHHLNSLSEAMQKVKEVFIKFKLENELK